MKSKKCRVCGKIKPLSDFYYDKKGKYYYGQCKKCKISARKQYPKKSPKYAAKEKSDYHLIKTYGLTREQHKQMYVDQNGCCFLCRLPIPYSKIVTDHNHSTGKVRKLLCYRCNMLIGLLENTSTELLNRCDDYIVRQ